MVDIMQTALRTIVAFCFLACSSTVTGGADDPGYAGSAGMASAGSAGSDSVGSGGAAIGGGNNAGDTSSGGSASVAGSVANGGGGAAPIDCTASLPKTFVWQSNTSSCFYCVNSPCWTAELTWDSSSLHYDEVASDVTITVSIHSSGSILMRQTGCSGNLCTLDIADFTFRTGFKVVKVSNGYQITASYGLGHWEWDGFIQPGTCDSYGLDTVRNYLGNDWDQSFYGIILPCVQPSA
jgi:hypothetical protein